MNSKLVLTTGVIGSIALFVGAMLIVVDPLFENDIRYIAGSVGALMGLLVLVAFRRVFGKQLWVSALSLGVLVLMVLGVYVHIAQLPPPASGVDAIMVGYRATALRCIQEGVTKFSTCSQDSSWKVLPSGWRYTKIEDADMSDGTFAFGAHSRAGDVIFCTEQGCLLKDARGQVTVLATTTVQ